MAVNWTQRLLEACLPPTYTRGRPLEPLKLLSNLPRDVEGDVGLGSQSAVAMLSAHWPQTMAAVTKRRRGDKVTA